MLVNTKIILSSVMEHYVNIVLFIPLIIDN